MTALVLSPDEKDLRKIVLAVNQLGLGRSNAVGTVTLTANATTTTVTAQNCASGSSVHLTAKTAHAAAALATTYIGTVSNGSFVITHANNAQTDRDFFWVALG